MITICSRLLHSQGRKKKPNVNRTGTTGVHQRPAWDRGCERLREEEIGIRAALHGSTHHPHVMMGKACSKRNPRKRKRAVSQSRRLEQITIIQTCMPRSFHAPIFHPLRFRPPLSPIFAARIGPLVTSSRSLLWRRMRIRITLNGNLCMTHRTHIRHTCR
jgi:hypothetical protein